MNHCHPPKVDLSLSPSHPSIHPSIDSSSCLFVMNKMLRSKREKNRFARFRSFSLSSGVGPDFIVRCFLFMDIENMHQKPWKQEDDDDDDVVFLDWKLL
mmetsp:Transcript_7227/g.10596  ORF Transcript_7227/g.10596 Transcript_7227/m.10596 type:complete len:99 (-) Transcript_7227:1536-1832(-)